MSIGFFITPEEPLKSKILFWKGKVKKELKNQPYVEHPPHLTLINLDLYEENQAISNVKEFISSIRAFNIKISQKDVFFNDISTNGHTIYYRANKTSNLEHIQSRLAVILAKYKKSKNPPEFLKGNEILYESYKNFGSPFIGSHWIPHLTVASLQVENENSLLNEFLSKQESYTFMVEKISIWKINGDDHYMIDEVDLV